MCSGGQLQGMRPAMPRRNAHIIPYGCVGAGPEMRGGSGSFACLARNLSEDRFVSNLRITSWEETDRMLSGVMTDKLKLNNSRCGAGEEPRAFRFSGITRDSWIPCEQADESTACNCAATLLLFFLHRTLGVGENFVGHQLRNDVVVVHFHAVAALALGHGG